MKQKQFIPLFALHETLARYAFVATCVLLSVVCNNVQSAPVDAGQELQRQQQQEFRRNLPTQIPKEEAPIEKDVKKPDDTTLIYIKGFVFSGNISIFTVEELFAIVDGYAGKKLTLSELNSVVSQVTQHYRAHGYITSRAILPPQDVTDGIVNIEIQEGRFDGNNGVKINSDTLRLKSGITEKIFTNAVEPNKVMHRQDVERAVLLLRDLPGIDASANLEAGSTRNTSRVVLDITEGPILNPSASFANSGSRLTGEYQTAFSVDINNLFGRGEQFTSSYQESVGSGEHHYFYTRGKVPLGYTGWKLGGTLQYLDYEVGKEFKILDSKGNALQAGVDVEYPLIRRSNNNVLLSSGFEYKRLRDKSLGVTTNHRILKEVHVGVFADNVDRFFGGGYTQANLKLYRGDLDLSGADFSFLSDQSVTGARTHGKFNKLSFSARRIQRVTNKLNLIADVRSQLASTNLSSSEKLQLGGSAGVRAYPGGEASGDAGVLANIETHYTLMNGTPVGDIRLKGFYDWGRIRQFKSPGNLILNTPNSYSLSGYGVGLNANKAGKFDANLVLARRIGSNPGRNEIDGNDSDGSKDKTRLWLSVGMRF